MNVGIFRLDDPFLRQIAVLSNEKRGINGEPAEAV
jgi:hypothetical protein